MAAAMIIKSFEHSGHWSEATEIHADNRLRVSIRSSGLPSFEQRRISIEKEIRIELTASEPQRLSVFRKAHPRLPGPAVARIVYGV